MLDPSVPVATLVLDHSECAAVFARHRIDYCCKGQMPLADACRDRGLEVEKVVAELESAIESRAQATSPASDLRDLTTRVLIIKVIAPHHQYLHRALPFIDGLVRKVSRVHGDREPALREVERTFKTLAETLRRHLAEEEATLFPALIEGRLADARPVLLDMQREHAEVGQLLEDLRRSAADFEPPAWACNSYRTLMRELAALVADTLTHVHVENHVLLPRYINAPS